MKNVETRSRLALIASMCIWGTIGLVRRYLPVPSGFLSMTRGLLGAVLLLLLMRLRGDRFSRETVRANGRALLLSGALIGFNWILLFEAYRHTTVAIAELCYNMAPLFILVAAPFILHERLTPRRLFCLAAALLGIALISDIAHSGFSGSGEVRGVLLALAAAVLYASVVLLNKRLRGIGAYEKTILQIGMAGVVLIPYVLLTEDITAVRFTPGSAVLLLVVGFVHTGAAYALYFGTTDILPAHTLALAGYIDPIVAVLLSALVLREPMTLPQAFGAALVLCAAAAAELPVKTENKNNENNT